MKKYLSIFLISLIPIVSFCQRDINDLKTIAREIIAASFHCNLITVDNDGRPFNKRGYMAGKTFTAKNNAYPLPQDEIINSQKDGKPVLVQNAGY